jgi:hypothetical protein
LARAERDEQRTLAFAQMGDDTTGGYPFLILCRGTEETSKADVQAGSDNRHSEGMLLGNPTC